MPLSMKLLWLAEIITPRSARMERVIIATPGGGQRAEQAHIHPHAGEPGDERGLDHIAG